MSSLPCCVFARRRRHCFAGGKYLPLRASGKHGDNVIAFARADMDDTFIVIAPRLVLSALLQAWLRLSPSAGRKRR